VSRLPIVLASTSIYRKELLNRLQLPFITQSPDTYETPLPEETPKNMASRLAVAKAKSVSKLYPSALIIGSDQVADLAGTAIGKPGTYEKAAAQLRLVRGKTVDFHTAVCLYNSQTGRLQSEVVTCEVSFRNLTDAEIENYLQREPAFDCAGSAKAEGLGIALIAHIKSDDPNALIGLPLIKLIDMLNSENINPI
jgi:septum formation protein